jgi:hypothetical protein
MTMSRTNRVRNSGLIACHDSCDSEMAPSNIKRLRRLMKRRERAGWRKEISRS